MMKVGIIGLGLMGSSLAMAIKKYCPGIKTYGYDNNTENLDYAYQKKTITAKLNKENISQLDLLFLAVPVITTIEVVEEIMPYLNLERTLLTDLGSTKTYICKEIKQRFPALNFIGGHPMTGRETSGPKTADADLFCNKSYILIADQGRPVKEELLIEILEKIGAKIIYIDSEKHDDLVSLTSHLPHVIAIVLMNEVIKYEKDFPKISQFMGQGFRDFTRIAASSPLIWKDIFLTNQEFILDKIDKIINALLSFKNSLLTGEEKELIKIMEAAKIKRSKLQEELWEETDNVI